ncbi:hypothetical protein J3A83DRAFT_4190647 [Scleroderma citrinum]
MSDRSPQNDPNSHLQQIRDLNDHFLTAPVEHFDRQKERFVSKISTLDGAITSVMGDRVPPEGGTNRIYEDTQLAYLNRDGRDRKFQVGRILAFFVKANAQMGPRVIDGSHSILVRITLISITTSRPPSMFNGQMFYQLLFWLLENLLKLMLWSLCVAEKERLFSDGGIGIAPLDQGKVLRSRGSMRCDDHRRLAIHPTGSKHVANDIERAEEPSAWCSV